MSEAYISEIRMFSYNFAPKGWALCNGQLLPIMQHQALFSLLGTTYGGDGITTFALPDLRERVPIHQSNTHPQGDAGGSDSVQLDITHMPTHTHGIKAYSGKGNVSDPAGAALARPATNGPAFYSDKLSSTIMDEQSISTVGSSAPIDNRPPYTVVNFSISLQGIYPSRS